MNRKPERPGVPARRRLEGDHRAAPAGRPPLVRRHRQGGRPVRGRGPPARPAADRGRRHAGRRGHRPARARASPARPWSASGCSGPLEPVADALAELDEVDYVVVTAGTYDLLVEVVCESDEHLLELISGKIRTIEGVDRDRDVHVPQAAQADLLVGCALSPVALGGHSGTHRRADWTPRRARRATSTPTSRSSAPASPGLWTAYYLAEADPTLRIVVLEAETAGFGASRPQRRLVLGAVPGLPRRRWPALGRPRRGAGPARRDARHGRRGRPGRRRRGHRRPLRQGRHHRARPHPRPAGPGPGGGRGRPVVGPRRGRPPAARRRRGRGDAARQPAPCGATYTPDCAAIHPARLVRGLADAVERRGVRAPRAHPVHAIEPGRVATDRRHRPGRRRSCARPRATPPTLRRPAAHGWRRSTR